LAGNFSTQQKNAIMTGVVDVGLRMGAATKKTATDAFKTAYGTRNSSLKFVKGTAGGEGECATITAGACTSSAHLINVASFALNAVNNVVHELGHAFNNATGRAASNQLSTDMSVDTNLQRWAEKERYFGFGSTYKSFPLNWQMSVNPEDDPHYVESGSEVFADMFLGWTYNTWYGGSNSREIYMANAKSHWMGGFMSGWFREME
jgi:hypothetical protein